MDFKNKTLEQIEAEIEKASKENPEMLDRYASGDFGVSLKFKWIQFKAIMQTDLFAGKRPKPEKKAKVADLRDECSREHYSTFYHNPSKQEQKSELDPVISGVVLGLSLAVLYFGCVSTAKQVMRFWVYVHHDYLAYNHAKEKSSEGVPTIVERCRGNEFGGRQCTLRKNDDSTYEFYVIPDKGQQ